MIVSQVPSVRLVLLDRDNTLIDDPGYLNDPKKVRLLDGVVDALTVLHRVGVRLVIVSNQSGLARGLISPEQAQAVHDRFEALLNEAGIELAATYYCPHGPDEGCRCRKPEPGMLFDAMARFDARAENCVMVGDKASDIEAGQRAGCSTVWFGKETQDWGATLARILELLEGEATP